jgi:hypothetical protein
MVKAFCSLFFVLACVSLAFSQNTEEITFTTYYPSPYGSYKELDTNRLRIGNPSNPVSADGVVRFNPINLTGACNEGEIYYDNVAHSFKYCDNNGAWKNLGGGRLKVIAGRRSYQGGAIFYSPGATAQDFIAVGTFPPPAVSNIIGSSFAPDSTSWGILCNASKGWQATGCNLNTAINSSTQDVDVRYIVDSSGNSGCETDNEEYDAGGQIYVVCAKIE